MRAALVLALFFAACTPMDPVGGDDHAKGDDLLDGLGPKEGCEDWEGTPVAGATSYLVGRFIFDDNEVHTTLRRLFYANQKWKDNGGDDCEVRYYGVGTKVSPEGCGSCDYGLELPVTKDLVASNCPEGLDEDYPDQLDVYYNVVEHSDGSASLYFPSGNLMTDNGQVTSDGLDFVGSSQCKWF